MKLQKQMLVVAQPINIKSNPMNTMKNKLAKNQLIPLRALLALAVVLGAAQMANATTYTWNVASPGDNDWNVNGNWSPSTGNPGTSDTAIFGVTGTASTETTINNIVGVNTGITTLAYTNIASGAWHVTQIPATVTLTVSGATLVGGTAYNTTVSNNAYVTSVAMTGAGTFAANGNLTIGNSGTSSADTGTILDLSGLTNFTYSDSSGTIAMGVDTRSAANFKLAQTNVITVGTWNANATSSSSSGTGTLTLGAATNVINVNTFNIGEARNVCTVQFPGTGSFLKLRDASGGNTCAMPVGIRNNSGGSGGTTTGTVNLNGNSVDVQLGTLTIGKDSNTSATGADTGSGTFSFDTGAVSATTVAMGITAASSESAANGTITVGANGTLTIGTGGLSLVNENASSAAATGTLNISGGTVTCNGSITKASTSGTGTITFSSGGTLQMALGCTIGSASIPIDTFTLDNNATFQCAVPSSGAEAYVGTLTWPSLDFHSHGIN